MEMSRYCQKCTLNYKFKVTDPLKYEVFSARYEDSYLANHKRSAEGMEVVGIK